MHVCFYNESTSTSLLLASAHRNDEGELVTPELVHLECKSTCRAFEPTEDFRECCPWMLVICHNEHTHPIPIPSKTLPLIKDELFKLMYELDYDLADLAPRRFLRHPSTKSYLTNRLPTVSNPMLSDLHPSLANRDHLRGYIAKVQSDQFPQGTGWGGK